MISVGKRDTINGFFNHSRRIHRQQQMNNRNEAKYIEQYAGKSVDQ
jgi:hypothetical protein